MGKVELLESLMGVIYRVQIYANIKNNLSPFKYFLVIFIFIFYEYDFLRRIEENRFSSDTTILIDFSFDIFC